MEETKTHQLAGNLKWALLAAVVAAALWTLGTIYQQLLGFGLLQQPGDFEPWLSQDGMEFWYPLLARVAVLALLLRYLLWVLRLRWGRDLTWAAGEWRETDPMAQWMGATVTNATKLRESPSLVKALAIGGPLALLVATVVLHSMLVDMFESELDEHGLLLLLLVFLGLLTYLLQAWTQARSHELSFTADGLCDASFFRTLRLPWSHVASFKPASRRADAQGRPSTVLDGAAAPRVLGQVWLLSDEQGRELLRLRDDMVPPEAFASLKARLQLRSAGSDAVPTPREPMPSLTAAVRKVVANKSAATPDWNSEDMLRKHEIERIRNSVRSARHGLGMLLGMVLLLSPFVLGTTYLVYKTLWFQFAAEQANGRVVEVRMDEVPSLVVEYRVRGGKVLRTESDGSDAFSGFAVGERIRVFYDADDPTSARLDHFIELWLGPILLGGLTALLLAVVVLIPRSISHQRKRR